MDWLILYDDRDPFSSEDGSMEDAPAWGVQVIVERDPEVGAYCVAGKDFYVPRDGRWMDCDAVGVFDQLVGKGFVRAELVTASPGYTLVLQDGTRTDWLGLMLHAAEAGLVKFGRNLPTTEYREIFAHATAIAKGRIPPKSARYPHERQV